MTTEGGDNIVVQIPGQADEQTRQRIEASAQLQLRAVLLAGAPATTFVGEDGTETPYPTPDPSLNSTPTAEPTNGSDPAWITDALYAEFLAYDCRDDPARDPANAPQDEPLITCEADGSVKYILGPVELDGSSITDATFGLQQTNGQWAVNLKFDDAGTKTFGEISERLFGATPPLNQFAFVLDGFVLSAPSMNAIILGGDPSITGSFTQETAQVLADQLKYGALPLSFEVVSADTISATLGSQQLQIGLIAGLIGLALVAIYSLIVYRAWDWSSSHRSSSMGVLTYITLCILAWRMGFRLSLAGVAGLIVSIGFTADSFIIYFEEDPRRTPRRASRSPAPSRRMGPRARTIYISKSVNILAAVVLYILADASVKGFAFTLGLTTVIDVLIFILFTHPVMQLLARTRFFGIRAPLSGIDPAHSARSTAGARSSAHPWRRAPKTRQQRRAYAPRRGGSGDRRSPNASRQSSPPPPAAANRPVRQGEHELMRSMSQLGNDLYTGKTSFPFVGTPAPVVHHRGGARHRLGPGAAVPGRSRSPSSSPADRSSRSRVVSVTRPVRWPPRRSSPSCPEPSRRSRPSARATSACRPIS